MPKRQSSQRQPSQRQRDDADAKLLDLARVSRATAGGRRFSFRAAVIIGDKQGKVGLGIAKGRDVAKAVEKATNQAKKRMITVPIAGHTIPHEVEAKFGASRVILRPQKEGRGLVAGGAVRLICEKAGIRDISAKFISKTHNKINNARATLKALEELRAERVVQPVTKKEEENATAVV